MAAVDERSAEERLNSAFGELKCGRYQSGWIGYESRFQARGVSRQMPQPLWRGEPLDGRSILVHREQGLGDEILFASCFGDLVAAGAHCTVTCDARLARLFGHSFPACTFESEKPARVDWKKWRSLDVDYQIPAGSVPQHFRRKLEDFPRSAGFLRVEPRLREKWRRRLAELGSGPAVGVSWQGGQDLEVLRHAPLDFWRGMFAAEGIHFVNLQHGDSTSTLRTFRNKWGVDVHHWDDVNPWTDLVELAAMIQELDLVITVTNSVAHLAGALGTPVWIVFTPAWGAWWILNEGTTPWYPSSTVYSKRNSREDWTHVQLRLQSDLSALTRGRDALKRPAGN